MYNVAVVGDKDSILAFKAMGIEVFETSNKEECRKIVDNLAKNNYGVIYITEQFANEISETIDRYVNAITPTIILIPSNQGSLGIGLKKINENMQKAVGMNIL